MGQEIYKEVVAGHYINYLKDTEFAAYFKTSFETKTIASWTGIIFNSGGLGQRTLKSEKEYFFVG